MISRGLLPIHCASMFSERETELIEIYKLTSFVMGAMSLGCILGGLIIGRTANSVLSFRTLAFNLLLNVICIVLYYLFYKDGSYIVWIGLGLCWGIAECHTSSLHANLLVHYL